MLIVFLLMLCFAGTVQVSAATVNAVTSSNTVKTGSWVTSGSGKKFQYSDGSYAKSVWLKIGGQYYYFKKSGKLATKCFAADGSNYYYLNGSGIRVKNIRMKLNGKCYYLNKSGIRVEKKWVKIAGRYYYFGTGGVMAVSQWIGNYYVDANGVRQTDCVVDGYYLNETGKKTVKVFNGKYIFVGDSRMVGMSTVRSSSSIKYIAKVGMGYSWLESTAGVTLQNYLDANPDVKVVLALGVNDLGNIQSYITYYKNLIKTYPKTKFYVLSVNPVNETKGAAYGYSVKNSAIVSFNSKLSKAFGSSVYLNSYSYLKSKGFETSDGIHYTAATYEKLYTFIIGKIK